MLVVKSSFLLTKENMIGNRSCDVAVLLVTSVARATMIHMMRFITQGSWSEKIDSLFPTYCDNPDT